MNIPTMTIGETEQDNELMKLRKENGYYSRCINIDYRGVERVTLQ